MRHCTKEMWKFESMIENFARKTVPLKENLLFFETQISFFKCFFHIKIIENLLFSFLPSHWKRIPRYLLFEIKPKQSGIFFIFCQITYSHTHVQIFTFSLGISVYLARFRYSLVSMLGGYIIISCRKFQEALGIFRWYWWVFHLCSHEGMHLHLVVLSMHCVPLCTPPHWANGEIPVKIVVQSVLTKQKMCKMCTERKKISI